MDLKYIWFKLNYTMYTEMERDREKGIRCIQYCMCIIPYVLYYYMKMFRKMPDLAF